MTRRQRQDLDSWALIERLKFTDDELEADRRSADWLRVGQYRAAAELELMA